MRIVRVTPVIRVISPTPFPNINFLLSLVQVMRVMHDIRVVNLTPFSSLKLCSISVMLAMPVLLLTIMYVAHVLRAVHVISVMRPTTFPPMLLFLSILRDIYVLHVMNPMLFLI